MFDQGCTFFNVRRAFLHFPRFSAQGITRRMTFRDCLIVLFNNCRVLSFRFRRLRVVLMNLPRVTGIYFRPLLRLFALGTNVFCNGAYVIFFTSTVSVRSIRTCHCSGVNSRVASLTVDNGVMLVRNVSMSNVRLRMEMITQICFLVIRRNRHIILFDFRR